MIVQKYTFLAKLQKVYSFVFVRHNKMKLYVQVSGFLRDAFGFSSLQEEQSTVGLKSKNYLKSLRNNKTKKA